MKTLKLYEISAEVRTLADWADDPEADLDSFLPALDAIKADLAVKAGDVACYIRELEIEAQAVLDIAEAARKRAQRMELRADSLRAYLMHCLSSAGMKKVPDPRVSIAFRKTPAKVFIPTLESIPTDSRWWRVVPEKREPDKTAIKEALKNGESVGDCRLESGERLEIK